MKFLIAVLAFVAAAKASARISPVPSDISQVAAQADFEHARPNLSTYEFILKAIRNNRKIVPVNYASNSTSSIDNIEHYRNQIQQIINGGHQLVNQIRNTADSIISEMQAEAVPTNIVSDGASIIAELGNLSSRIISSLGNMVHQLAQPNSFISDGASIIAEEGAASAKVIKQLAETIQHLAQPRSLTSDEASIIAEGAEAAAPYVKNIDQALGTGASEMGNIINHLV